MPAKASGQVLERQWRSGRGFALRVRAYGKRHYVTLGLEADGWTPERAEDELQNILADVRRAIWIPPDRNRRPDRADSPTADEPEREPTFHAFASQWLAGRHGEISPATYQAYGGALTHHLLPYFAHWRLTEIDIPAVDAYRRYKVAQAEQRRRAIADGTAERDRGGKRIQPLSPVSINKTIDVLQMVLAQAVEYGHTASNPAAGRRRRLKKPARRPIHLDSSQQIQALLDAATELDRSPVRRTCGRRATVAMLMLAGPRAEELCHLCWRDVDLANGRIHIGRSKTQAGLREIPLLPLLRDELATHKADSRRTGPDDPVFPTSTGSLRDKDNLRVRVLAPVLRRADTLLADRGHPPLPAGVTPHKLRHTFASILVACGEDPASVMAQLGHTDPKFTLRVYTHLMRRDPAERARLRRLVEGETIGETPADERSATALTQTRLPSAR
ncbi:MAG: site-specific integrase [Actinobacteria bacterium]|nr:site-specific integrase [Actinomycetota bacterium]